MWSQERIRELIEAVRDQLPGSIIKQEILDCLEDCLKVPAAGARPRVNGEVAARKGNFKRWGVQQINANGKQFSSAVIDSYCVGLNTYGRKVRAFAQEHVDFNGGLTELLLAHDSLFEVVELEEFVQIKAQLRQLPSYSIFSSQDHGTRHAAMDLYARYLQEGL